MYYNFSTGIFWDYENVPLRQNDYSEFLLGIRSFVDENNVVFARVYSREKTLSKSDEELINSLDIFDYKWVKANNKNAADYSMIQSCFDIISNNEDINQVVIITGDGDFTDLLEMLKSVDVNIILIAQSANYNQKLLSTVDKAFSVNHVSQNPYNWWQY